MLVTCHTPDCPNADVAIDLTFPDVDADGVPVVIDSYACGACGQTIDDVVEPGAFDPSTPPADA